MRGVVWLCCLPAIVWSAATFEWRGVWVATVENIDWPSRKGLTVPQQQAELLQILDTHEHNGVNALAWQIRPSCDAFYQSSIEPWSEWLTGTQGVAPNPLWDPLAFLVDEAHRRKMEVHAWMNPYRAVVNVATSSVAPTHVSVTHPQWIVPYGNLKVLNPGIPDVVDYIVTIIRDVATRYQVDGIHWDDYFYPYPIANQTFNDSDAFARYNRGIPNLADWRRDNVNRLFAATYAEIRAVGSQSNRVIKFGISPFGIWKNGVPAGITGLSAYDSLYCDALAWLQAGTIDYLSPQLYWPYTGGQDYGLLMPWWEAQSRERTKRHVYPGLAVYRLAADNSNWPLTHVTSQIQGNRVAGQDPNNLIKGQIFFSSKSVTNNLKGFQDALRNSLYTTPALPPPMPWLGQQENVTQRL